MKNRKKQTRKTPKRAVAKPPELPGEAGRQVALLWRAPIQIQEIYVQGFDAGGPGPYVRTYAASELMGCHAAENILSVQQLRGDAAGPFIDIIVEKLVRFEFLGAALDPDHFTFDGEPTTFEAHLLASQMLWTAVATRFPALTSAALGRTHESLSWKPLGEANVEVESDVVDLQA